MEPVLSEPLDAEEAAIFAAVQALRDRVRAPEPPSSDEVRAAIESIADAALALWGDTAREAKSRSG